MAAPDPNAYAWQLKERCLRVSDYVRRNLDAPLDLHSLAKVAHFSPFHFHRVFKSITGETLTRFVQRARLERAAYLMKASPGRKLDSIAVEVGFAAHSDFTRVFKKHYDVAPSAWDRKSRLDEVKISGSYEVQMAAARADFPPGPVELISQPARRLIYVRTPTPFLGAGLHQAYERLCDFLQARGVDLDAETLVGWCWDNYETTPISAINYDLGFTVPGHVHAEGEFALQVFEAHRAATVQIDGPLASIAVGWVVLFDEWLPTSVYEPADLPSLKVFDERPDELGWEHYRLRCVLPVRKNTA